MNFVAVIGNVASEPANLEGNGVMFNVELDPLQGVKAAQFPIIVFDVAPMNGIRTFEVGQRVGVEGRLHTGRAGKTQIIAHRVLPLDGRA
jgi:hypothetical protein